MEKVKNFIRKNKKACIIGGIVLLVVVLAIALVMAFTPKEKIVKAEDTGITANTSSGIVQDEEYQGLKFTNVTLIRDEKAKQYTLTTDVTNTTKEAITTKQVDIVLKNESGNEIITLLGYIGDSGLKPNETKTITASTSDSVDLSKATVKEIKEHAQG